MSKSQRVLDYVHTEDGMAFFANGGPGGMEPGMESTLSIPVEDYMMFGEPEQITITIVVGDTLTPGLPTPEQAAAAGLRLDVPPGSVGD